MCIAFGFVVFSCFFFLGKWQSYKNLSPICLCIRHGGSTQTKHEEHLVCPQHLTWAKIETRWLDDLYLRAQAVTFQIHGPPGNWTTSSQQPPNNIDTAGGKNKNCFVFFSTILHVSLHWHSWLQGETSKMSLHHFLVPSSVGTLWYLFHFQCVFFWYNGACTAPTWRS